MASSSWRVFIDWSVDPIALEEQISGYRTLGGLASYRKISALLVLLAVLSTIGTSLAWDSDLTTKELGLTVIVYSVLAAFVYRGDRWALVLIMVLWTLDKAASAYMTLMLGNIAGVLVQALWWAFYMSFFWKAFTVERERRSLAARIAEVAGRGWDDHVHERE